MKFLLIYAMCFGEYNYKTGKNEGVKSSLNCNAAAIGTYKTMIECQKEIPLNEKKEIKNGIVIVEKRKTAAACVDVSGDLISTKKYKMMEIK